MASEELNPLQLMRDYIHELKVEFHTFSGEYHSEILKVWQEIVRMQEQLKTMQENQKKIAKVWGLIGGAIPAMIAIGITILLYWLSRLPPTGGIKLP